MGLFFKKFWRLRRVTADRNPIGSDAARSLKMEVACLRLIFFAKLTQAGESFMVKNIFSSFEFDYRSKNF
jgi:hypothetical protein